MWKIKKKGIIIMNENKKGYWIEIYPKKMIKMNMNN